MEKDDQIMMGHFNLHSGQINNSNKEAKKIGLVSVPGGIGAYAADAFGVVVCVVSEGKRRFVDGLEWRQHVILTLPFLFFTHTLFTFFYMVWSGSLFEHFSLFLRYILDSND